MSRSSLNKKAEEIKQLEEMGRYTEAANAADSILWEKTRDVRLLGRIANVYEKCDRYRDAKDALVMVYNRTAVNKNILFRLAKLSALLGDVKDAEKFYWEFRDLAPKDSRKMILAYYIMCARKEPDSKKIQVLEKYVKIDFDEQWAYTLAQLYYSENQNENCIKVCDEIILWYSGSEYGNNALKLKHKCLGVQDEETEINLNHDTQPETGSEKPDRDTEEKTSDEEKAQEDMLACLEEADGFEDVLECVRKASENSKCDNSKNQGNILFWDLKGGQADGKDENETDINSSENEMTVTAEEIIDAGEEAEETEEAEITEEAERLEEAERTEEAERPETVSESGSENQQEIDEDKDESRGGRQDVDISESTAEDEIAAAAEALYVQDDISDGQSGTADEGIDSKEMERKFQVIGYLDEKNVFNAADNQGAEAEKNSPEGKEKKKLKKHKRASNHFSIKIYLMECSQMRGGIKYAVGRLKNIHREAGEKTPEVVKISDAKLSSRGVGNSIKVLKGRDLVVEGVTDITYESVNEMVMLIDESARPAVIVLLDTPTKLALFINRHRSFAEKCTYIYEEAAITRAEFIEYVNSYAYKLDAVLDEGADEALEEIADGIIEDGLLFTASDAAMLADRAIQRALKPGIKGIFEAKKDAEGYLILRSRHFSRG